MSPGESPAAALRRAFDMAFAKEPPPAADLVDLIALRAGAWTCAVRVSDIAGVMPLGTVVPYPSDDTSLLGLIAVRASPLPVYDLAARLGEGSARAPRWALLSSGNAQIALAVDEIEGYLRVSRGELLSALPITEVPAAARAGELLRVGSSPIPVVDVPAIVRQLAQQLGQDTKER
jgi:chemotaxis signal transduction protein